MKRKANTHSRSRKRFYQTTYIMGGSILTVVLFIALIVVLLWVKKDNGAFNRRKAPDYAAGQVSLWEGEPLPEALALVNDYAKPYVSAARYLQLPSTAQTGEQDIALVLQLTDGTTRTENAKLTVRERVIRWELGTEVTPVQLLGRGYEEASFSYPLSDITAIGTYPIDVLCDEQTIPFELIAQDTTPPQIAIRPELNFYVNQPLTPADFVAEYSDLSPVEFHFSQEPDTLYQGDKQVQLIVTDSAGNSQTFDLTYRVSGDGEPPVISGMHPIQTIAGIQPDYLRGVEALDAHDGVVVVTASEPEGFSLRKAGEYPITYTAVDEAGNKATETITLTILPSLEQVETLTEQDVMHMGDAIIKGLHLDGMATRDQLKKIFTYVQDHMMYKENHHILDWEYGAVVAMYQGYGDCRNYYAFSRLLLTCAGFENMMVEKQKLTEREPAHFWNLVNVEGAWYHFDATPRNNASGFFLWTDDQMDSYSARNAHCFNRDKSLYPATPNT